MCNCNQNPANICTQCQKGNPCGCPPDYSILPQPVPCGCCPSGYTYFAPTSNWPNGYCYTERETEGKSAYTQPIPCSSCAETISSDCVILSEIPCLGGAAGASLSQLFATLCNNPKHFIEFILTKIGLDPDLGSAFCQLVQNCPASGQGTTPIITGIIIHFP